MVGDEEAGGADEGTVVAVRRQGWGMRRQRWGVGRRGEGGAPCQSSHLTTIAIQDRRFEGQADAKMVESFEMQYLIRIEQQGKHEKRTTKKIDQVKQPKRTERMGKKEKQEYLGKEKE